MANAVSESGLAGGALAAGAGTALFAVVFAAALEDIAFRSAVTVRRCGSGCGAALDKIGNASRGWVYHHYLMLHHAYFWSLAAREAIGARGDKRQRCFGYAVP